MKTKEVQNGARILTLSTIGEMVTKLTNTSIWEMSSKTWLMMVGFQSSCRGWKQAIKWATKQCLDYLKGSILLWFVTDYYICKGSFPNYRSNLHIFWNQWHTGQWWWRLSKRRMHPSSSRSLWWQQDYWHIRWSLCCRRRLIPIRHWKGRGASAY